MKKSRYIAVAVATAVAASTLTLVGCGGGGGGYGGGGGGGGSSSSSSVPGSTFSARVLTSDQAGVASHVDANLRDSWGLAITGTGFVMVADRGAGKTTFYDDVGTVLSTGFPIPDGSAGPSRPAGIVYNSSVAVFNVTSGGVTSTAPFIFATGAGTLHVQAATINQNAAVQVYDGGSSGTVYKGLALLLGSVNRLYAADFHNRRIDVFDSNYNKISVSGSFTDPTVPADYAPFNIQAVGNQLYVTYAKKDPASDNEITGAGFGYIAIFDANGVLVKHLISGGALNAPWGIAVAPGNFGVVSNALLVGNSGDGKINAYDTTSGALLGTLNKADGSAIVVDGLHGLAFNTFGSSPILFYAAGPANGAHGAYGRIDMN
ncbi:MAG TPA: TIGR03118 family protein [Asticcacaulis sp.]|nr:TIGR03118 family protein [Asticcacaulis sp.]